MERIEVLKTYKVYIGGQFVRSESGRYYTPEGKNRKQGNICLCSRKDLRNAVTAARSAQSGWAARTAYNRGQIIYRIAEMLEGRKAQFADELKLQGASNMQAKKEVQLAIDRIVHYAGWSDKYQQLFSAVNPVSGSYFNFSLLEPTGVVYLLTPEKNPLLGLVSTLIPIIVSGNSVVATAPEGSPLTTMSFAEVLNSSDVPAGVINLMTGRDEELNDHAARHMDINAIVSSRGDHEQWKSMQIAGADNMKRMLNWSRDWVNKDAQSPYMITDLCEVKTTWHPIERISASGSGY